jgi:hypothetical protein
MGEEVVMLVLDGDSGDEDNLYIDKIKRNMRSINIRYSMFGEQ